MITGNDDFCNAVDRLHVLFCGSLHRIYIILFIPNSSQYSYGNLEFMRFEKAFKLTDRVGILYAWCSLFNPPRKKIYSLPELIVSTVVQHLILFGQIIVFWSRLIFVFRATDTMILIIELCFILLYHAHDASPSDKGKFLRIR